SIRAATRRPPTVIKAKIDAVCPAVAVGLVVAFFFRDRLTAQDSYSSSSRRACADASRASRRCSGEQYCWSNSDLTNPIFFPQRKQSMSKLACFRQPNSNRSDLRRNGSKYRKAKGVERLPG